MSAATPLSAYVCPKVAEVYALGVADERKRIAAGATYHAAARQYDRLLRLLREHRALVPFREERRLNARGGRVDVIVPGWSIGDVRRIAIRLINDGARQYAGLEREARRVGGAA